MQIKLKKPFNINLAYLVLLLIIFSCNRFDSKKGINYEIAGSVNGEVIYFNEIDKSLDKKLYDILYQVYLIRKTKLDEKIGEKLIEKEAKKCGLKPDQFLNSSIYEKITLSDQIEFAKQCRYDVNGIPELNNSLKNISINTVNGKLLLEKKYKEFLLKKYIDSLRNIANIQANIQPPPLPSVDLSNIKAYYKGNEKSKVTLRVLSDLECEICKEAKPIYDRVFNKYKSDLKFAFTYYSGGITLSSLALEAAGRQNLFWPMYDSLCNRNTNPNQEDILTIANTVGLDMIKFAADLQDSTIYKSILENFGKINEKGFYGTPTIVINNKVILDAFSETDIEKTIQSEISKNE